MATKKPIPQGGVLLLDGTEGKDVYMVLVDEDGNEIYDHKEITRPVATAEERRLAKIKYKAQEKLAQTKANFDKADREYKDAMLNLTLAKHAITEEERKKNLKNGYNSCPQCKSGSVDFGSVDSNTVGTDGIKVWQDCSCPDCNIKYRYIFTLTDLELL